MTTQGRNDLSMRPRSAPSGESELGSASDPPEPLLRPQEVARLLACSPKAVYAWAASGSIPCVRLGRLVRFAPSDVRRFVEMHTEAAKQASGRGSGPP